MYQEIAQLKQQVESLNEENSDLQIELKEKNQDMLKMTKEFDAMQDEKQQMQEAKMYQVTQMEALEKQIQFLLQQKTEVENEAYESQSKCSQFKLEIVRLDKENMMLDDRLIEKERELERLRGELSVMERMFGNIGNRPINNQNNQIKKQETVTSYEYLATPNMANNSKLRQMDYNGYNLVEPPSTRSYRSNRNIQNAPSDTKYHFQAKEVEEYPKINENYTSARGTGGRTNENSYSTKEGHNYQNYQRSHNQDMPLVNNVELQTQSKTFNHLNKQSLIDGSKMYDGFIPQANQIEDNHQKAKQIAEVSKNGSKNLLTWGATESKYLIF